MISGNVIESNCFTLQNLLIGGGSTTPATRANYAVCSATYMTPLIKGHVYAVYFNYSYTVKSGSSKKPEWVGFWPDGGDLASVGLSYLNDATSIEYFNVFQLTWQAVDELYTYGTIYQGPSTQTAPVKPATEGDVTGYVTNFCLFDVTELYQLTKGKYDSLAEFGKGIKGDLQFTGTKKFNVEIISPNGLLIGGDYIYGNIVEAEGLMNKDFSPSSSLRAQEYFFDNIDWVNIYNNQGRDNGVVTKTKVEDTSNPFYPEHPYVAKVVTKGANSDNCYPGLGGIVNPWNGNGATTQVVVQKVIAKIPVGYKLRWYGNTSSGLTVIGDMTGTGSYKEYTAIYNGNYGTSTSRGGYIAVQPIDGSGVDTANVTWYIAFYGKFQFDASNYETYQGFSVMPNKDCVKGNTLLASKIDSQNLLPNGDGSDCKMTLPSKYEWATDINDEIQGYCCLRQPSTTDTRQDANINGSPYIIGEPIPINPMSKYKLTYRVKAEKVPSQYLSAIVYYRWDGAKYVVLNSFNVTYVTGTRTTLAEAAAANDTTLTLTNIGSWKTGTIYAGVGFKTNPREEFKSGDVERSGSSACLTTAINGNKITLSKGLSKAHKAGEYVYQHQDQGNYYYPASQGALTDGEWVSIEKEFGNPNQAWDGAVTAGGGAWDIPLFATHMGFAPNIYANTSGKPIYYDNIRIEEIHSCGEKRCDKVQIKRYDGERKGVVLDPDSTFNISGKVPSGLKLKLNTTYYANQTISVPFHYKDVISVSIGNFSSYGSDPYYRPTAASISIDGTTIQNGSNFTMPYKDMSFTISTILEERYRIKKGSFTSGVSLVFDTGTMSLDSDSLTSDYLEVSKTDQINWRLDDISQTLLNSVSNDPWLKITLVDSAGHVTTICDGPADLVATGVFEVDSSATVNVEIYEYHNEYTVTLANPSPNWSVLTDNETLNTSTVAITCKATSLQKWSVTSGTTAVKTILSGATFTPELDYSIYKNTISFYMPSNDISISISVIEKPYYRLYSSTTSSQTQVRCYVNGYETQKACQGEEVTCLVIYTGTLVSVKYYNADNSELIGNGSSRFTFTMPSSDVTIAVETKVSSSSGGQEIEGEQRELLRILNIPGTCATRVPRAGASLNNPMINYMGAFDELTEYYNNVSDQLITDTNEYRTNSLSNYAFDWERVGKDGNSIHALRSCYINVIIDFWISEQVSKLDVCIQTTDLNAYFETIELNGTDINQALTLGGLTGTYYSGDGYLCRLVTTAPLDNGLVNSVWFALDSDTNDSYIVTFDHVTPMSSLEHDSNTLVLCPGFQSDINMGSQTMVTNPLLYAEDGVIANFVPSNLDGQIYSLYNVQKMAAGEYSIVNIILGWDDPDNTYITLAVINKPTVAYTELALNGNWAQIATQTAVATYADDASETGTAVLPSGYLYNCDLSSADSSTGGFVGLNGSTVEINLSKSKETFGDSIDLTNPSSELVLYFSVIYRGLMWVFLTPTVSDQEMIHISGNYDSSADNQNYWIDVDLVSDQGYNGRILNIAYD